MYSDQSPVTPDQPLAYTGEKGPLFKLMLKTGFLTLITLGIYRFWQKTRLRKYIWSSTKIGEDAFEYTGTGMEKFLGFLVAIVFLAVYLGLIQMILFFFGLNVMVDPETASEIQIIKQLAAIYISFFAVVPFILFAVYRSRRYKMARTRFRGIRLGMEKGAWGYVWRAIGYGLLSAVSLGILTPLMTFKLEEYQTNRSFYGTTRMRQDGKWTDLYGALKHVLIALGLLVAGGILMAVGATNDQPGIAVLGGVLLAVGYVWFFIGAIYYSVRSFGYLMSHKVLGNDIRFTSEPRTGTVIKTFILGGLLLSLLTSVVFGIVAVLTIPFFMVLESGDTPSVGAMIGLGIVVGVGYLAGIVIMQGLAMILITQPLLAHYITTIRVVNVTALDHVHQREAETGIDADGFADALDIGGAI